MQCFRIFAKGKSDPCDTENIILGRMDDTAPLSLLGRDIDINEDIAVQLLQEIQMDFITGFHVYKDIWHPFASEKLPAVMEPHNMLFVSGKMVR